MKISATVLALVVAAANSSQRSESMQATDPAHASNGFHFEVRVPLARVAPLFGPEAERSWAGKHWNPEFLYPRPGKDIQGAVFTVPHGPHTSVWVNTIFDLPGGKMQYVCFVPDVLVTVIDVKLAALNEFHTAVEVVYARTALRESANDDVRALGDADRSNGPQWQTAIESTLGAER